MKKLNFISLLIVLLFFFILACDKKELINSSKLTKSSVSDSSKLQPDKLAGACPYPCTDTRCQAYVSGYCGTPTSTDTVATITNPNNQFDYIGSLHNKTLAYTLSKITSTTPQSNAYILHNDNVYLKSAGYDTVEINNAINASLQYNYTAIPDTAYTNNPSSLINKIYNDGRIDSYTVSYMNSIIGYLNTDIGSNTPSSAIYTQFANHIITIENNAKNDTRITSNELQYILSTGSVARYSIAYWANYYINNLSGTGVDAINKNNKQISGFNTKGKIMDAKKPYNWKAVGEADIAGAAGGAATGLVVSGYACIFTAGGGCAAIPAAMATGALGVGVGTSVQQAVQELFNWWS